MVSKFDKNGVPLWSSYVGVFQATGNLGTSHIKVDTAVNQFYVFGANISGTQD